MITHYAGSWVPLGFQGWVGPIFIAVGKLPMLMSDPWGIYIGTRKPHNGRFSDMVDKAFWISFGFKPWTFYAGRQ